MRASGRRSRRSGLASTRSGRRWDAWTAPTGTGTWCASALRWRPMRSPLTERAADGRNDGTGMAAGHSSPFRPSIFPSQLRWELILEPGGHTGAENMALDMALLGEVERTGRAFLRLYRFDPPCLSFGRHEPARSRYDHAGLARLGIDVVRRPTGGRAVWHEHEVTYAVAAPVAAFGERGSTLRDSYRAIHARLAAALRTLGVPATLAPDRPRPLASALDHFNPCFAAP